jgi:cytoskeletal protein CcmA (bactofilin family)
MKNHYIVIGILLALVPFSTSALELRASDQPVVGPQEKIIGDLYIAGGNVTSSGSIGGDLVTAGGSVLLNGEVKSDILAGGGTVTILGKALDDVRVFGGNVIVTSEVVGDVIAAGGNVQISGKVGGDVILAGGAVSIDGPVTGNARIAGGEVRINAPIGGDVEIQADRVVLGKAAIIGGNFSYHAATKAQLETGAQVKGETVYTPRVDVREGLKQGVIAFLSLWFVLKFLMLVVGAMVFGLAFKKYGEELTKRSLSNPVPEFFTGLVTVIVLPIISAILIGTVIGIPLGTLGFLAFFVLMTAIGLITPVVLGNMLSVWLFKGTGETTWKTILLGVVVFYVAGFIPFVGWLARTFFFLLTLGASMRLKWDVTKEWR